MGVPSPSRGAFWMTTGPPSSARTTTSKSPWGGRPRRIVTASRSSTEALQELAGESGAGRLVVVLEEDVGVAVLGRHLGQALGPQVELGRRVLGSAQAYVRHRSDGRNGRRRALGGVGHDEGGAAGVE